MHVLLEPDRGLNSCLTVVIFLTPAGPISVIPPLLPAKSGWGLSGLSVPAIRHRVVVAVVVGIVVTPVHFPVLQHQ